MLIAPGRTTMNAPIAIIDPHVHWYEAMRFYEVRIYTPELNVAGVSILGAPFPTLGHSRFCSVAMTTGGPDTSDIFEEEINPANPSQYRYDGQWRDLTVSKIKIGVKDRDKLEDRDVAISFSHHGPIVARKGDKAYAMAIPYSEEVGLMDQCFEMMTARNLPEMKNALSHLQLMGQNIMVGTVQGDIYYLRNGTRPHPRRRSRPLQTHSRQHKGHRVERHPPMTDLVQIENPACGWMQNCNCSPAAMMNQDQPKPDQFARAPPHLQRFALPRHAPARRDDDRPPERRRERSTSRRRSTSPSAPRSGTPKPGKSEIRDAWLHAKDADKTGDAPGGMCTHSRVGPA